LQRILGDAAKEALEEKVEDKVEEKIRDRFRDTPEKLRERADKLKTKADKLKAQGLEKLEELKASRLPKSPGAGCRLERKNINGVLKTIRGKNCLGTGGSQQLQKQIETAEHLAQQASRKAAESAARAGGDTKLMAQAAKDMRVAQEMQQTSNGLRQLANHLDEASLLF
jgi:hypothetical protein